MTNEKTKELNEFYIKNKNKFIDELSLITGNPEFSEDLFHDGILRYIRDVRRWGGYEKISYERLSEYCKSVYKKDAEIQNKLCKGRIMVNDPLEVVLCNEEIEIILKCINSLKKIYKDVLSGYYLEKMSIKELAECYDLKNDTTSKRLRRGREKLRKELCRKGIHL